MWTNVNIEIHGPLIFTTGNLHNASASLQGAGAFSRVNVRSRNHQTHDKKALKIIISILVKNTSY